MNTIIIGGGPAGLMAAIKCASIGDNVTLLEKNTYCGKKLLLTGNGRCNVTSLQPVPEFLNHVIRNKSFMKTALYHFTPQMTIDYFASLGVECFIEDKSRVFPKSERAKDILEALVKDATNKGVKILYDIDVKEVEIEDNKFVIKTERREVICDKLILANGGKSYSLTGSNGHGYVLASKLGHTIVPIRPALCPILLNDTFVKGIEGLSLNNVALKAKFDGGEKNTER